MPTERISLDEYEATIAELADCRERRDGAAMIITGHHEDLGRTILRREAGAITTEVEELGLVRDALAPMEAVD